jgi:hypothetical protein
MLLVIAFVLGVLLLIGMLVTTLVIMRGQHIVLRITICLLLLVLFRIVYVAAQVGTDRLSHWVEYDPSTRQRFTALVRTNDHQAVLAAAVALIQQMRTNALIVRSDDLAALSPVLAKLQPNYVRMQKAELELVFADTRDKYGFCVSRTSNGWELAWCEFGVYTRLEDWFLHPLAAQAARP